MAEQSLPGVLLTDLTNVAWITEFSGSSGFVIVTAQDAVFITDGRYTVQAAQEVTNMRVAIYQPPTQYTDFLVQNARDMGLTEMGIEAHQVSVQTFETWQAAFSGITLKPLTDFASPLRMVKTASELDRIRACCGIADAAFQHIQRLLTPGVSEFDISLEMELFFRRQGGGCAFDTIVASGIRGSLPHGRASEKIIESGDLVTLDFGCAKDGLNSDITRTVAVGQPSSKQRDIYDLVLKSQLAALEMMRPGVKAGDVDAKCREVFAEKGLEPRFSHGLGHGLGRLVHDFGRLGTGSQIVLEAGQVWTVEPGLYFDDWGGVRIEDDVLITDDGIEILTHSPKELLVFGA